MVGEVVRHGAGRWVMDEDVTARLRSVIDTSRH